MLRPGRFDRQIVVPNPDVVGREKILKVHARKVSLGPNVDLRRLARAWGIGLSWLPHGHISLICSRPARAATARFLAER